MAENTNGGKTGGPGQPKKPLSTDIRLLLALVLTGLVLFVSPYFYKTVMPPAPKTAPVGGQSRQATPPPPANNPPPSALVAESTPGVPTVAAPNEQTYTIDTDLFSIVFTNRGGVVKSWQLKKFKAHSGARLELVNTAAKTDLPFALHFPGHPPATDLNQALYQAKVDGLNVDFDFADGQVAAHKSFRFQKSSYLLSVVTEVTAGGQQIPAAVEWRGGFGDMAVPNPAGAEQTLRYDVANSKLVKTGAKAAKDAPQTARDIYSFAGIEDQYFVAAFLPVHTAATEVTTFSDSSRTPQESKEQPFAGVAIGGGKTNDFSLYVGPKDLDILRAVNPKLEQVVDFGFWWFLAKPLFLLVHLVTETVVHSYGWSIVAVTVVLNFILFPLKLSSMKSMKKMQALQPQVTAINDKYKERFKNVSMMDPRRAEQQQEIQELWKKHGVSPLGGCVPMVLQIPFFIAFYKVFSVSVEMRGANWLWVSDLSQPEKLPLHFLPIIMVITQFVMQKMTPTTPGADPNQQRIMQFMPLMFGLFFYNLSSGLVLYYLTSNLVGILQQVFFNKTSLAALAVQSVQPPAKKKFGRK